MAERKRWTAEDRARIREAYERGESTVAIAKAMGCAQSSVCEWLRKDGAVLRPRGRPKKVTA